MKRALDGIRVLDLTIWMFGPFCTQVLGDFGADVIKVEPPSGEPGRGIDRGHPEWEGISTRYLARNRNKRSIAIDLRNPEGREVFLRLAEEADVVIENFRPGVVERLGIDYERVKERNPKIIYTSGSGFGPRGPYAAMGGQDRVAQALSGFVFGNGDPGTRPSSARTSIMDSFGGMVLVQGVLLALLARQSTGEGQRVDLALFDAAIAANIESFSSYLNAGDPVGQKYDPLMGIYETADSLLQLVMVFVRHDSPLSLLCEILEIDDLTLDPRFSTDERMAENAGELVELLQVAFRRGTTEHWLEALRAHDIICSPVYDYADLEADPQVAANEMIATMPDQDGREARFVAQPIRMSGTPAVLDRFPPRLGEHTEEVLRESGWSEHDVAQLKERGVVR